MQLILLGILTMILATGLLEVSLSRSRPVWDARPSWLDLLTSNFDERGLQNEDIAATEVSSSVALVELLTGPNMADKDPEESRSTFAADDAARQAA